MVQSLQLSASQTKLIDTSVKNCVINFDDILTGAFKYLAVLNDFGQILFDNDRCAIQEHKLVSEKTSPIRFHEIGNLP